MIFEVTPDQIKQLDSTRLVQLMKRLLLAECGFAKIPLRSAGTPLQITVPDGGEDGRVEWREGVEGTNYLPRRFCIFQSKAQVVTSARATAEVLKRRAKRRKQKAALNCAMSEVLSKGGAYVLFTSHPLTGQKIKKLCEDIRATIKRTGASPAKAHIDIYDANRIADWANAHPAVALWVASGVRLRSVSGFQSYDGWSLAHDVKTVHWVDDKRARFFSGSVTIADSEPKDRARNSWTFDQAADAAVRCLSDEKERVVRIVGPSGFGKTRFAHELFSRRATVGSDIDRTSVIYADQLIAADETAKLALDLADAGSDSILVVDDCPDDIHSKLAELARRAGSRFRLVTLDVETRVLQVKGTLAIGLEPASDDLIGNIAKGVAPTLDASDTRFIQELSNGFPRMAVLAAQHEGKGRETINSVEQVLDRIVWGKRVQNNDAQRALESLSLFEWVGVADRSKDQAEYVARELAQMSKDAFVEHVMSFRARGIVLQRGDFVQIQPIPLAARLGARRLSLLPDGKLRSFFSSAPTHLQLSLLRRLRWLDTSPVARAFAAHLLAPDCLGNLAALNTDSGSECLDRLVHVDPAAVMNTIDVVFGNMSVAELKVASGGRRHLVWALEKLVFRRQTFFSAATLLRRLGAAETEGRISNNASGEFKGLYQLYLGGTEAPPEDRLQVLDEGLHSGDPEERSLCVNALDHMLDGDHFSRTGGAEEVGSGERLQDWTPRTYGEIWGFYRAAMDRLADIATRDDPLTGRARNILGSHIRGLINQLPFAHVKAMIERIVAYHGFWPRALQGLNTWLYFDRQKESKEMEGLSVEVRALFDQLMPSDPVTLVEIYTLGWQADFHNPDNVYNREKKSGDDFKYAIRKSVELADVIAADPKLIDRSLERLVASDAKTIFAYARRLAEMSKAPVELFKAALSKAEAASTAPNLQFFSGLIAGTDQRNPEQARQCIQSALRSPKLKSHAISMIGSGKLQVADLRLVIKLVQSGDIEPWECAKLSYGRGLDHLAVGEIVPLLDELEQHGAEGIWTILDIVSMYLYGGKEAPDFIAEKLKRVILAPALFDKVVQRTMDGHHLEQIVRLLSKQGEIDDKFASLLVEQLLSICAIESGSVFFEFDRLIRSIFKHLIQTHPCELWAKVSRLLVHNNTHDLFYLDRLIDDDRDDRLAAGILFGLPKAIYLDWVRADQAARASIVAKWLPITSSESAGKLVWHADLESYVNEFGREPKVLDQLSRRMRPGGWCGSLVPHLEPMLRLLASWSKHPLAEVRTWANQQTQSIQREITDAWKRDEESGVRM